MRILVELPGGAGVVRRDDGDVVVTHDISDDTGRLLRREDRYQPVNSWLPNEQSVVGGLLPPGAVAAEIVDDRGSRVQAAIGDGAYAAILDQPIDGREPVVCCRDAAGAPVRRPLGAEYPSARVEDAEEPCPACGAVDYEQCVPTESWRGGTPGPAGTIIPSPIVVCCRCGHEERSGGLTWYASPADEDEDEDEATRAERIARWRAERRVQQWYTHKLILRAVTFPIYAAEGWAAQISGSHSCRDDLTGLTIAHTEAEDRDLFDENPRLEVTTSVDGEHHDELAVARQAFEQWALGEPDRPDLSGLSDAAVTLWFRADDRRRRAAALNASPSEASVTIDGSQEPFVTLSGPGGRWVAVRRHDDLTITILARDLDPATLTIEPIADPAARLLGTQPEEP